jgi:hypothetical protein
VSEGTTRYTIIAFQGFWAAVLSAGSSCRKVLELSINTTVYFLAWDCLWILAGSQSGNLLYWLFNRL